MSAFCFGLLLPQHGNNDLLVLMSVRGSRKTFYRLFKCSPFVEQYAYVYLSDEVEIALCDWLQEQIEINLELDTITPFVFAIKRFIMMSQARLRRKQTIRCLERNPQLTDRIASLINL